MNSNLWRPEAPKRDCLFDPKHNIVTRANLIVTQIVIKTQFLDDASLEQSNDL